MWGNFEDFILKGTWDGKYEKGNIKDSWACNFTSLIVLLL